MNTKVMYRGVELKPGSDAHRLFTEGRLKDLDTHLRFLNEKERCLREGQPLPSPPNFKLN